MRGMAQLWQQPGAASTLAEWNWNCFVRVGRKWRYLSTPSIYFFQGVLPAIYLKDRIELIENGEELCVCVCVCVFVCVCACLCVKHTQRVALSPVWLSKKLVCWFAVFCTIVFSVQTAVFACINGLGRSMFHIEHIVTNTHTQTHTHTHRVSVSLETGRVGRM